MEISLEDGRRRSRSSDRVSDVEGRGKRHQPDGVSNGGLMSLLDKIKGNIQETAASARGRVKDLQTERELGQAYGDLGRKTFELISAGGLQAGELQTEIERIRKLQDELGIQRSETAASTSTTEDPGITGPGDDSHRVGGPL